MKLLRRPRRNRKSETIRKQIQETQLSVEHLIYPIFLVEGNKICEEIKSLPNNFRWSLDTALKEIGICIEFGLKSFIFFPAFSEDKKDKIGSYSYNPENFYLKALRKIKNTYPDIQIVTDVALDPYSSDGHDGIVRDGKIMNDETLKVLGKMAVEQAKAGADIIGPSDMMDGRIQYIREHLDKNQFQDVSIMSYSVKYASAFYGPFRDALNSAPRKLKNVPKDKKTYQMNPANKREALLEAELDYNEGADYLMIKPATLYLDIIHILKEKFPIPIVAYHVSGECAMIIAATKNNWLDYKSVISETLLSIKRAGADIIISYFAKDYAQMLKNKLL